MSTPQPTGRTTARRWMAGLLVLATVVVPAACGDDDGDSGTAADGVTTTTPEEKVSSDADVAAGLGEMLADSDAILAAGSDSAAAGAAYDEMHETWEGVEGTVKANDPEIYITIEDSMSLLSAGTEGDAGKATTGAADLEGAITEYLAAYPG